MSWQEPWSWVGLWIALQNGKAGMEDSEKITSFAEFLVSWLMMEIAA